MGPCVRWDDDKEYNDVHCRQTGAAAAASPEMAVVRQARTVLDDRVRHTVFWILAFGHGGYSPPEHPHPPAVGAGREPPAGFLFPLSPRPGARPPRQASFF